MQLGQKEGSITNTANHLAKDDWLTSLNKKKSQKGRDTVSWKKIESAKNILNILDYLEHLNEKNKPC